MSSRPFFSRSLISLHWVLGFVSWCAWSALDVQPALASPAGLSIAIFPFRAQGLSYDVASALTQHAVSEIRGRGHRVINESAAEKSLGVDIDAQVTACHGDTFCLVEIGGLLHADRVLLGQVFLKTARGEDRGEARGEARDDESEGSYEFRLIGLDVSSAKMTTNLVWRLPRRGDGRGDVDAHEGLGPDELGALQDMIAAAVHQAASDPDVRLVFDVSPGSAVVAVYGERLKVPESGGAMPYWSGIYEVTATSEGYHRYHERKTVVPGREAQHLAIALERDPLYVKPRLKSSSPPVGSEPFGVSSRSPGSGVSPLDVGRGELDKAREDQATSKGLRMFAQPYPWILAGAGVATGVVGLVVCANAQSDYNALAADTRFDAVGTVSAEDAVVRRRHDVAVSRAGSVFVSIGVSAIVGAVVWLLVDGGAG